MKYLLTLLLCIFSYFYAEAQYFQTGQDPASLSWRQISTDNFQLIYPDYYEEQAQVLAQKLEKVYNYASYSLKQKPKSISIIFHTQTVQSNGLVAYAPKRSEFYTTPNQGIYPLDWLEQLAVHEFRHVVQIDKINSELPALIKILLGEQGTALVFGAYLPWWFIEGDAVVTETALSNYGRGRFPSFLMEHKAQLVEKEKYSYDKAYNGSFKNFVPNHYQLGYYMVANSRARYGADLWEKVLIKVGKKPFSLNPFNSALKAETGFNKVGLYNSIFDSLAVVWKSEDDIFHAAESTVLTKPSKDYTNYTFAHRLNDHELVAYKTGYRNIPAFVKIDELGNETVLYQPGVVFDESINSKGDWLAWSEHLPDLRWSHSGRSVIRLFNISTRDRISLIPEYKAFAPAISNDLTRLAVVEADFSSNYYLSVYDISSKKLICRIQTPDNNYILSPTWENEHNIIAVILTSNGKRLAHFNTATSTCIKSSDLELGDIKNLRVHGNSLSFVSNYTGKDAVYRMDLKTLEITQLYEPRFGAAYPELDAEGNLLLSDYTSDGFRLIELEKPQQFPIKSEQRASYSLAEKMAEQELGVPDLTVSDTNRFNSQHYAKAAHLLNFHSWAPVFVDPYEYDFAPGISMMSQNVMGTAETILGYKWNLSEETGQFNAKYTYKGWYPVLDFEFTSGKRASQYSLITDHVQNGQVIYTDTVLNRFTWKEFRFSGVVKLPLNLSRGKFYQMLQPEIRYELTQTKETESTPSAFPIGNYHNMSYRLYYHYLLRQSYQDVFPNFGFILDGSYYHSPFGQLNLGSTVGAQAVLYLPGLNSIHGLKMYAGTQKRKYGDHYSYSDIIRFPRGWRKVSTKDLSVLMVDYKIPLLNPDFSIGGLTYIKRVNTTLFYDYGSLTRFNIQDGQITGTYKQSISSIGVEVIGDLNFLRFYAPVQLGFRTSYLTQIQNYTMDLLISIDFNSL